MSPEALSYWQVHGVAVGMVLGLCLAIIPRITTFFLLVLTSFASGGVLWWLGWLFLPHFLVAGLATLTYWDTNPMLVLLAWIWALIGTGAEGKAASSTRSAPQGN